MSDLHFEFMRDGGRSFLAHEWPEHDVTIIAGDLCSSTRLEAAIRACCDTFKKIVYVAGNHEYYRSSISDVKSMLGDLKINNFHYLDNSSCVVDGQRFVGGTMWFGLEPDTSLRDKMGDFDSIEGVGAVYYENEQFLELLETSVSREDVVVTHHLPSYRSTPRQYMGDPTNCYFTCDVEKQIQKHQPKLWVHGHTHSSFDYTIGDTRIYCNPFGYLGENPAFNQVSTIEV